MNLTFLSGRTRLLTHLTGWSLVALLSFVLISSLRGPQEGLLRTLMNISFLFVLFYGNSRLLVNRYFETGRYVLYAGITILCWIGAAALRTWVELQLFGGSIFANSNPSPDGGLRIFLGQLLAFFLLWLFSSLYQLLENRHTLELRHQELQTRHAEAQLNYLKARINPHFLFNSLHNIYAAATLQHPRTADMVLRLSDLLRYVTYDAQAATIPIEKEIAQIRAYVDLFQLKNDQPLPIHFSVEGSAAETVIEPMLLLPLVENALKHGDLEENPEVAFIHITLKNTPKTLLFRVENSYNPKNKQKDSAGGVGLENIRQRLALNYPNHHRFTTQADPYKFTAELEINFTP